MTSLSNQSSSMTPYFVRDIRIDPPLVLAPMEGVTNKTFRRLVRSIGGQGLTYTEFVASKALKNRGKKALAMAEFDPDERPIAIQIYGNDPQIMAQAAQVVEDLGASIIDINMGCPSKKVCANSGGSALMKDPDHAVAIVRAVRAAISVPLTVKMRSGFDHTQRNAPELSYMCQEEGAEAITIHWRTREDRYGGIRAIDKIAETKSKLSIPLIANGDIIDASSAQKMFQETGCDGVMIGRGAIRNPWVFQEIRTLLSGKKYIPPTSQERRIILEQFIDRYREDFRYEKHSIGKIKQIAKYFYSGLPNGEDLRRVILRSQSIDEIETHIHNFFERDV